MTRISFRMSPLYFCMVFIVFSLFVMARPGMSQLPTATILGVVKDSSGAVVPDVAITARSTSTGQTRTATSGPDGSYRFSALPVGPYELRAEHAGFQSELRGGLVLAVSDEAVVNFTLQVGGVEQTVSVTAEAPLVNTTSGSLGGLVNEEKVADLPLNGRNYLDLTLMQPGIVQHKNTSPTAPSAVGTWYSSNGAPVRSNNYMLDGAIMTNATGATSASADGSTLGIEGIREYKVLTNSYSAEYGMTMGSQMTMVSKSGTNQFHGAAFDYLRNSVLDARNFFDYTAPNRLPAYKRNQFGASGGGPLRKDKTFFFLAYEGLRDRLGVTTVDNVMGANCHVVTNNPCAGGANVPANVQPLLAIFPLPNLNVGSPTPQFTYPFTQPTREDFGMARIDQAFGGNDNFFGRYTIDDTNQNQTVGYPAFVQLRASRSQFATLSENHIFSSVLLNTARVSFSRTNPTTISPAPYSGPGYTFVPGFGIGDISIGSVTGIGPVSTAPSVQKQNLFTYSDDVFYSKGRHSFKFGALINHYQDYYVSSTNAIGSLSFANVSTFLQGQPNTITALTPGSILDRTYHYNTLGFYGQDDIRVFPNFTLNVGLRYEFQTVPQDIHNIQAALRDVQHDASTTLGPVFKNMSLLNFSPRLGFAWDVKGDGKTAVRGGFAELYDIGAFGAALNVGITATPPYSSSSSLTSPGSFSLPLVFPASALGKSLRTLDYNMQQPHLLSYNLTVDRQLPGKMALTIAYAGSRGINLVETTEGNPTVATILSNGSIFFNAAPASAPNSLRTNPNFGYMEFKTAGANSFYNSLQFQLVKQVGHGLQFQSSYTWGKIIDETQGQQGAEDTGTSSIFSVWPTQRTIDRAPANFDITQNWRFNLIYQIPSAFSNQRMLHSVVDGWMISSIVTVETGYPFSPVESTNISRSGTDGGAGGIDRPNLLPGFTAGNIIQGGPTQYFNPNAFALQSAGFLGNAGRNILRGPGLTNLDFSLSKDMGISKLGEAGKLEFRAEIFNILNHTNFGMPNDTVFTGTTLSTTAGQITRTATPSRQIQLALKLLF